MKNYILVETLQQLEQLKLHINSWDYFSFDTETTGLNVRKNKVIGLSVCGKIGESYYLPRLTWNKGLNSLIPVWQDSIFKEIITMLSKKELLMWNGSFDIRIVKNDLGIDLTDALVADVMLMKHTVEEDGDFALKKVAIQYQKEIGLGDLEVAANEEQIRLKENVKSNGGSTTKDNYEMFKADLEVMGAYAAADADLTMRLAEYFSEKLRLENLEEFFYDKEVMPLYKYVTIPMETHGVDLDLPLIRSTLADIVIDLDNLESSITAQLDATPEVQDWKRRKALEAYPIRASGKFAQLLAEHYNLQLPINQLGNYSFNKKAIESLPDSLVKNLLLWDKMPEEMDHTPLGRALDEGSPLLPTKYELLEISWKLFSKSGNSNININSKQQMGEITFDCLGFKPLGLTPSGKPQFDDDMIQVLADKGISWAKDLSNYNKLIKIKGTYIDRFLEAEEDGKYYFSYKQHGTISGRYSGDAQQLPRPKEKGEMSDIVLKYNNVIRKFFISAPGRTFIDDDYESLEPHVFAHVSGDEGLRDIFRKGHDFYSSIAIPTEKLQGVSADKKADNYLGKVNKPKRQSSKVYSLGVPYGQTPYALGKTLGISTKEAEVLYNDYLNSFPDLKKWMRESEYQAKTLGFVKTETGRIRHLSKVPLLYKKHGDQLLNYMYVKNLEKKMGPNKDMVKLWVMDYKNGLNNAKNFQIQGLSASIVNLACIAISKEFKKRSINAWVCGQIHDQAIFNVPEDKAEECLEIVQRLMENTTKLSIQLKAPPSLAHNWKEGH